MPHTTYGVLKAIRSHEISSPRVADDLATGRPNACNLCHLDKPLDWTASYLTQWFNQPNASRPDGASNISHMIRLALAGDAGQRVLAAWHLGWAPALAVSRTNWVAPVLSQLLDDPYAAVRCVAERSLKSISPELKPADYDFTIDPRNRQPMRDAVWTAWAAKSQTAELRAPAPHLLCWSNDFSKQRAAYEVFLRSRNDRAVRLRE